MGWQAPRQVAVSPGGVLLDPAGWTRTLWTRQTHLSRFSSARSAATCSVYIGTYNVVSPFASTFFGNFFIILPSLFWVCQHCYVTDEPSHQPAFFSVFVTLLLNTDGMLRHLQPVQQPSINLYFIYITLAVYSVKVMQFCKNPLFTSPSSCLSLQPNIISNWKFWQIIAGSCIYLCCHIQYTVPSVHAV